MPLVLNLLENANIIRYWIIVFDRVNFETFEQVYDERFERQHVFCGLI